MKTVWRCGAVAVLGLVLLTGCGSLSHLFEIRDAQHRASRELAQLIDARGEVVVLVELDSKRARMLADTVRAKSALRFDDENVLRLKRREYAADQANLTTVLAERGISVVRRFRNLPLIAVRLTSSGKLKQLVEVPGVVRVFENRSVKETVFQDQLLISQPEVDALGFGGVGTGVAVLDSEVHCENLRVPACEEGNLGGCCNVVYKEKLSISNECDTTHGTEVAGVVARNAPGAWIVSLNIRDLVADLFFEECGSNAVLMAAGIDRVIELKEQFRIVAINLSWGDSNEFTSAAACPKILDAAFEEARQAGIISIVASGNDGWIGGVSWPACSPLVVSVASVIPRTDEIAYFSNIGYRLDLLAPGSGGTSLAAPVVAAAWAGSRGRILDESLDDTLMRFKSTGVQIQHSSTQASFPRIDLAAAFHIPAIIKGAAEAGDLFGSALAAGDIDGDGRADLAVGAPGQVVDAVENDGVVNVLYGAQRAQNDIVYSSSIWGGESRLGSSIAICDFDGDGYSDLASGGPGVDGGKGAIQIAYGSPSGLNKTRYEQLLETGVVATAERGDGFGASMACGDFNGDRYADLVVGVPNRAGGATVVFYGSTSGVAIQNGRLFQDNEVGLGALKAESDGFGTALAVGDFNGDGFLDLAAGAPGKYIDAGDENRRAGAVAVIFGGPSGLIQHGFQAWNQGQLSNGYYPVQEGARFGETLAAGDFNGDGFADLAVGVPNWSCERVNQGAVYVLFGSPSGFSGTWIRMFARSSGGWCGFDNTGGVVGNFQLFGGSLAAGDFDGNGYVDLAIGVPGARDFSGEVEVLPGASQGFDEHRGRIWHQGPEQGLAVSGYFSGPVGGAAESNDRFGGALATGDFNGDGLVDLAIGVPLDRLRAYQPSAPSGCLKEDSPDARVGLVRVLFGTSQGLYFPSRFASGCSPQPCTPPELPGEPPTGATDSRELHQGP